MKQKKLVLSSIFLMLFIISIGEGLMFPILPALFLNNKLGLIVDDTYLSREMLYAISLALFPLSRMLATPILGAITGRYGKNKIILYGLGLLVFNYLLSIISILIHDMVLFLLGRLLSGFISGIYSIVGVSIISDMSNRDHEKASNHKLLTLVSTLGFILGPSLSMFIDELTIINPLIFPFIIVLILGIISLVLFWNNFRDINYAINDTKNFNNIINLDNIIKILLIKLKSIFSSLKYLFNNQCVKALALSYSLLQLALGMYLQSLPLYLNISYYYSPSIIARFFVVMALAMTISMYFIQKLINKYINYKIQVEIGLITISSLVLISWSSSNISLSYMLHINHAYTTWITALILYTLIPFLTIGFTNLLTQSANSEEKEKIMGSRGQVSSAAMFISALTVGVVAKSYDIILLISGISLVLSYITLKVFY